MKVRSASEVENQTDPLRQKCQKLETALLDVLLNGLSGRKGRTCILRRAQQAAYSLDSYKKAIRTSLFPTYLNLTGALGHADVLEACNLEMDAEALDPCSDSLTRTPDLKSSLTQVIARQQAAINNRQPATPFIYADQDDFNALRRAITEFLAVANAIKSNSELRDMGFELSTGVTAFSPALMAHLKEMHKGLKQIEKFKDIIKGYRAAASDLEDILDRVPRLDPLIVSPLHEQTE